MFVSAGDRAGRRRGAYNLISQGLTSGTEASVTFGNIPTQYRDLEIRLDARGTTAATGVNLSMQFNGDTGNNYTWQTGYIFTSNSAQAVFTGTTSSIQILEMSAGTSTANFAMGAVIHIPNYKGSVFYKDVHMRGCLFRSNAGGSVFSELFIGAWLNQSPINAIKLFPVTGSFLDGSWFSLYGIA